MTCQEKLCSISLFSYGHQNYQCVKNSILFVTPLYALLFHPPSLPVSISPLFTSPLPVFLPIVYLPAILSLLLLFCFHPSFFLSYVINVKSEQLYYSIRFELLTHSGVAEDTSLLRCYAVSGGN